MKNLTHERLLEVLNYEPSTGIFTWRKNNKIAGGYSEGRYWTIRVDGQLYKAHRLAVLYVTGVFPDAVVDHLDGDKLNNRYANLRPCSQMENLHNRTKSRAGSGLIGAIKSGGKFRGTIRANYKAIHLGMFDTPEEAHQAYLAAKAIHHPTAPLRSST